MFILIIETVNILLLPPFFWKPCLIGECRTGFFSLSHRGLILQDLTFINIGNQDLLPDGSINFAKRWQQFNILDNMRRFKKW